MAKKKKNDNNDVKTKSVKKNTTKENTSNVDKEILKYTKEKEGAINNKCPACGAPISFKEN